MSMFDLDVEVSDTEIAIQERVHRFARDVMRPAGRKLDRMTAEEVCAEGSLFWEVTAQRRELGVEALYTPDSDLTPLQRTRISCVIGEEMGWGDAGFAISFGCSGFPTGFARRTRNRELIDRVSGYRAGCWAITEPNHGTDTLDFAGDLKAAGSDYSRWDCYAKRDGDGFVIHGQKAAWVSNGAVAQAAALFCGVDMGDGVMQRAVFVVPLDLDGVSKGKPLDKIGQRALPQGEIFFDDVRIPASYMAVPPDQYAQVAHGILCTANAGMGTTFAGVAQSALDLAVEYARERVQGGVPIIQHQSVKGRIYNMFQKVASARALNRRVRLYNSMHTPKLEYCIATKVASTTAAFEVASEALGIFGGNGTSREYPIEKIFRDARASMIEDGSNEVLGLIAASRL